MDLGHVVDEDLLALLLVVVVQLHDNHVGGVVDAVGQGAAAVDLRTDDIDVLDHVAVNSGSSVVAGVHVNNVSGAVVVNGAGGGVHIVVDGVGQSA